jgi:23S rRNA (uracil1939-C5)-methyltransferase
MTVLRAADAIYGGYVLSKAEGIIFIKGAIPGEVVEVSLDEKKRDYSVASVIEIIEPSEARTEPECPYFGECGGCHLQFATYEKQVEMKEYVLLDCLRRIGGVEVELAPSIFGEPNGYRHRAQFKISKDGKIGFFKEGTVEVVEIGSCPLLHDSLNNSLDMLRNVDLKDLREVHITAGDNTIILLKGSGHPNELADKFINEGFTGVAFEDGSYRGTGAPYVSFDLNGLRYTVSPWGFLQSNWEINKVMVSTIVDEIGPTNDKRILDLYAGGGNLSIPISVDAAETIAVESSPASIADGKRNRSANRITGYKFIKATAETAKFDGHFDIALLDPPRAGLSKATMKRVLENAPETICYVSCNPSTFARDLKQLLEVYDIRSIRMVDMFPQTYHLEVLAFLDKKDI